MPEEKSVNETLYETLHDSGELEYGSTVKRARVLEIMGIEEVKFGTQKDFQAQELAELKGVGYIRSILINQGKWIIRKSDTYRVLQPSENEGQIESFARSGNNAYNKAMKLSKSTPPEYMRENDQTAAKIQMRQKAAKDKAELNKTLGGGDKDD